MLLQTELLTGSWPWSVNTVVCEVGQAPGSSFDIAATHREIQPSGSKDKRKDIFFQYVNWFLIKSGIIREDGNYKTAGDFSIMKFWAAWIENCYLKNWTVYENILHVVRLQIERAFIKKFMRTQWVEIWKKLKLMQEKKSNEQLVVQCWPFGLCKRDEWEIVIWTLEATSVGLTTLCDMCSIIWERQSQALQIVYFKAEKHYEKGQS